MHTLTGSYTYTHTDVAIPGRGPNIVFARTYNSNDPRVGPLGPGWTHSYFMRLTYTGTPAASVVLTGPQGRSDRYERSVLSGQVSYRPPAGVHTQLVENGNGTYEAVHKNQTRWIFDRNGRLTTIVDRYGNQSILSPDPTSGLLSRISDPAGRGELTLVYGPLDYGDGTSCPAERLCEVRDWQSPTPRVVRYAYDTNGRLWKVTDREGNVTTFGYEGTAPGRSHLLTTITDARGNTVMDNEYDSASRVRSSKDARGLVTEFQYNPRGVTHPENSVIYPETSFEPSWNARSVEAYDPQTGYIILGEYWPESRLSSAVLDRYWGYDLAGNLTRFERFYEGGVQAETLFCYDHKYDGTKPEVRQDLTRRIAPPPTPGARHPVTLYRYDDKDNLRQVIPPKGVTRDPATDLYPCSFNLTPNIDWRYATDLNYDPTGTQLLSITRGYTDPDHPELGLQEAKTTFAYDDPKDRGLVTKVIPPRGNALLPEGETPDQYATLFTYYQDGCQAGMLQSVSSPVIDIDGTQARATTTYTYDCLGRRRTMVDPLGNVGAADPAQQAQHAWEYEYDNEDRLRFVRAPAPNPSLSTAPLVTEFIYDAVGNLEVAIDATGQVTRHAYDERDDLKEVVQSPNDPWTWPDRSRPLPTPPASAIRTTYEYDNLGNVKRVTRADGDPNNETRVVDYAYDGLNVRFVLLKWAASPGKEARPSALTT